jgi:hypothetical protein
LIRSITSADNEPMPCTFATPSKRRNGSFGISTSYSLPRSSEFSGTAQTLFCKCECVEAEPGAEEEGAF